MLVAIRFIRPITLPSDSSARTVAYLFFGELLLALEVALLLLRLADAFLLVSQRIDLLHHRVDLREPSNAPVLRSARQPVSRVQLLSQQRKPRRAFFSCGSSTTARFVR